MIKMFEDKYESVIIYYYIPLVQFQMIHPILGQAMNFIVCSNVDLRNEECPQTKIEYLAKLLS